MLISGCQSVARRWHRVNRVSIAAAARDKSRCSSSVPLARCPKVMCCIQNTGRITKWAAAKRPEAFSDLNNDYSRLVYRIYLDCESARQAGHFPRLESAFSHESLLNPARGGDDTGVLLSESRKADTKPQLNP